MKRYLKILSESDLPGGGNQLVNLTLPYVNSFLFMSTFFSFHVNFYFFHVKVFSFHVNFFFFSYQLFSSHTNFLFFMPTSYISCQLFSFHVNFFLLMSTLLKRVHLDCGMTFFKAIGSSTFLCKKHKPPSLRCQLFTLYVNSFKKSPSQLWCDIFRRNSGSISL